MNLARVPIIIVILKGVLQNPPNNIINLPKNGAALSIKINGKYLLLRIFSMRLFISKLDFVSSDCIGASIL